MSTQPFAVEVVSDRHVAKVTLNRPPHNFLDRDFLKEIADALEKLSDSTECRAIILRSATRSFCAGADFSGSMQGDQPADPAPFYEQAMRVFKGVKPIVGAIGGPAIGAGLGLAMACDFRIATPSARFSANFCRLGIHPGFALSHTLPRLIGAQHAARLFYTGRRIDGSEAQRIGLVDELVDDEMLDTAAQALALEIATSAPLAVVSTRATLRGTLAEDAWRANRRELEIQGHQFRTRDFKEGVLAMSERRPPDFVGS